MPRLLLALAVLAATIFCAIECIQTDEREVRNLPKVVWLLLIILAPVVGCFAWWFAGRPRAARPVPGPSRPVPPRSLAPDDDPSFLAGLDRTNEERRRLAEWERELRAREQELRGRDPRPSGPETRSPEDPDREGPGDEPAARS